MLNRSTVISLCLIFCFSYNLVYSKGNDSISNGVGVIVIDAGHGGEDPGALGKKFKEKDITLAIALKVEQIIKIRHPDVKVILTRNTDVFVPLHERAEIANRNKADLFLSIHANANRNTNISGIETYAMGLHTNEKNLEVALKENAVITMEKDYTMHYEGYDPNSPESFIIFSLIQNTYLNQSLDFAGYVQQYGNKIANRSDRGVRQAGFLVLWRTTMPSVLIETGYISNPKEETYLGSESGQNEIAQAIANAFTDYKRKIESRTVFLKNGNSNFYNKNYETKSNNDTNNTIIKNNLNDTNSVLTFSTDTSIIFKIQIFASNKLLKPNSAELSKCRKDLNVDSVDILFQNNMYKYTIGNSLRLSDLQEQIKNVKKYYPAAFIIAVKNGEIVPLNKVLNKN